MIWFTSDTHFGHENVLKFTDRPWETIQQMNSVIVANINARVGEIDRRLDFKTWFFGHHHDDEWRDGRHRLIYRDIVPVGVRREDEDREPVG